MELTFFFRCFGTATLCLLVIVAILSQYLSYFIHGYIAYIYLLQCNI